MYRLILLPVQRTLLKFRESLRDLNSARLIRLLMPERKDKEKYNIPLWHKPNLSIEEAVAYSGIGRDKLYELTNPEDCPFVLWIGNRRMIKRKKFDEYIERQYSI